MTIRSLISYRWSRLAAPLLLAVASACGDTTARSAPHTLSGAISDGTIHPTPENIPKRGELAGYIQRSSSAQGPRGLRLLAARFAGAREVHSIGTLEGMDHEVFGTVEDIAVDEQGTLFVLDSRYNNVRIYDPSGRFMGAFGGPGRGPNEFMSPEALERDRQGRLLVADRHNRIKLFAPKGDTFESAATVPVEFVPEDFCLLDDRIYVQGAKSEGGILHAFSGEGEPVKSFGEAYRSANWLVRNQLSDGPIACSEAAGTIVVMFKYFPLIYGYSPDGRLRWVSQLADFDPMTVVETMDEGGRPVVSYRPPENGFDFALALQAAPGGYVVVQAGRHDPESLQERREYAELHTYLISARSGEGVYVGSHLPRISAVTPQRILAGVSDPFPQVKIYEIPAAKRIE